MIILNNENTTHLASLKELFKDADKAVITSPFLMEDLSVFFEDVIDNNISKLTLYTSLPSKTRDLIKMMNSLVSVYDYVYESDNLNVDVKSVKKLHGKAYLAYSKDNLVGGILSSANLTHSGLNKNHEWGIKISEEQSLQDLETGIKSLSCTEITEEIVLKILERTRNIELSDNEDSENFIDLSDILNPEILEPSIENQIWLKPIGHSSDHINEGHVFSDNYERLHFSRRRPSGVKMDDILITYGVGIQSILSVYRVDSKPQFISEEDIKNGYDERWPWFIIGENLTQGFGSNWWNNKFFLKELKEEFVKFFPDKPITDAGTQSFGAFNFGADKLHLDQGFGNWLYNKILSKEELYKHSIVSTLEKRDGAEPDIDSINKVLQNYMIENNLKSMLADECAEVLVKNNILSPSKKPGKRFREILRRGREGEIKMVNGAEQERPNTRWVINRVE